MTTTEIRPTTDAKPTRPTATRRFGYLVAIAVNFGMIAVVNNILEWDVVPFLTSDFSRLVGFVSLSLSLTIAANVIYLAFDPPWFKSLTQIGLLLVSLAVTIRFYQVFPFDFSSYDFDWSLMTRWILIIAIAGTCIGMLAEAAKLVRAGLKGQQTPA